jgi:hypothetical protein
MMQPMQKSAFYDWKTMTWKTVLEHMYPEKFPISAKFVVTPEWAKDVLDIRNNCNRRLDRRRVKTYAKSMIDGEWGIINDDICFGKDGRLYNGQHRLAAVVEAKMNVLMSFKFGCDASAIPSMDEGRKRSNLDVIHLTGRDASKHTLSCTNYLLEQSGRKEALPRTQILAFHDRHLEAAKFATQLCKSPFAKAPIHASLLRAWYHYSDRRDRLQKFVSIMADGVFENAEADSAAITLRNMIIARRWGSSGPERDILYRKTEAAIARFMEGESTSRLYGHDMELFPLPEEKF